ncbi:MAG: alpha-amylase family glycosyl hydrolase [Acutalibacteraceae bacterium]
MRILNKTLAFILSVLLILTTGVVCAGATTTAEIVSEGTTGITVHYKAKGTATPTVYYWNSLPTNIASPTYPGKEMTSDANEGENWYTYKFSNVTKINMLFIENGTQSKELTRGASGEYWYKDGIWYSTNPEKTDPLTTDLREDTIYFVITTRFYDGDSGNNVHCWDDSQANNPDSDPAWRGDFKGLIDKLDYIKALGFSAIWITPVVTNGSGYDYHGYHAFDFSTVDVRYESDGATYQDLINAAHAKGMKIVQDVVWQHTGNFGEKTFAHVFDKKYDTIEDLADIETSMIPNETLLNEYGLSSAEQYYAQTPAVQHSQRLKIIKGQDPSVSNSTLGGTRDQFMQAVEIDKKQSEKVSTSSKYNAKNFYHTGYWRNSNYDDYATKYCQIAGDCVDLNTENPEVADKIVEIYSNYIAMGVDAFRVDTLRHISRLSLNAMYNNRLNAVGGKGFYMFGECCTRYNGVWYRGMASESAPFYTWAETDPKYLSNWNDQNTPEAVAENINLTLDHWIDNYDPNEQPTSDNTFLDGNNYHKPDYTEASGMGVIDFAMHWEFGSATGAFNVAKSSDQYYNDATWNVVYVDSHDYGPGSFDRYAGGTQAWAENMCLMFTFRGIPCLYYGSEVEFQKGVKIDIGTTGPLSTTGRAYFGDYLEGNVSATDYGEYTATGTVKDTLNSALSQQLIKLNKIRRAVPALQKGQYSTKGVSGDMAFKRGYTDENSGEKSFACVAVTNAATFTNIPNGTYIDAVTGDTKTVTNGTLSISASGKGNCRVYVLSSNGYTGISGKIGGTTTYLK